jgi:hypothetical protein
MMRTLTPFLSALIGILLFIFFTQPKYAEVSGLQTQIAEYNNATDKYKDFSALLDQKLSVKTTRPAVESERLDRLIPDTIDDTRLLVDLEALAKSHKLLFGNVTTNGGQIQLGKKPAEASTDTKNQELATVDISFALIGTYDEFKDFLKDLETSLNIFEVTKISYSAVDGPFQQFTVAVRSYALPK